MTQKQIMFTKQLKQLNSDCEKLRSEYYRMSFQPAKEWFEWLDIVCRLEFTRIYYADKSMASLTKENILGMLRINVARRFVPLHEFGLYCNIE